ncbi:MAG: hypothetical protein M5U34_03135 [Chloroflexi bacterium]|nr:hypothetical protein [Chloroflexota bacterium]
MQPHSQQTRRWFDARRALIWPHGQGATPSSPAPPPHPAFAPWLEHLTSQSLRPDDLDATFSLYRLHPPPPLPTDPRANFNDAVQLLDAAWLETAVAPGETAELLTFWRVTDPAKIGPIHPPADATDTVFFTQILRPEGTVLSQHDSLDAPSWAWQTGDIFAQIHSLPIPPDTPPGVYQIISGVYDRLTLERLPTLDQNGQPLDSFTPIQPSSSNKRFCHAEPYQFLPIR